MMSKIRHINAGEQLRHSQRDKGGTRRPMTGAPGRQFRCHADIYLICRALSRCLTVATGTSKALLRHMSINNLHESGSKNGRLVTTPRSSCRSFPISVKNGDPYLVGDSYPVSACQLVEELLDVSNPVSKVIKSHVHAIEAVLQRDQSSLR
jgi:hypothetical protein